MGAAVGVLALIVSGLALVVSKAEAACPNNATQCGTNNYAGPLSNAAADAKYGVHFDGYLNLPVQTTDTASQSVSQQTTNGLNVIEFSQSANPTDAAQQSTNQSVTGSQTATNGGSNKLIVTQASTVAGPGLQVAQNRIQTALQAADVTQSTNLSGTNLIQDNQTVCVTAGTSLNIPSSHTQEGRQKLILHKQQSDAGRQDLIVDQEMACPDGSGNPTQPWTSNLGSPSDVQNQNTNGDTTFSPANQYVLMGPGPSSCDPLTQPTQCELGMYSNTGINHVEFKQNENLSMKAFGPTPNQQSATGLTRAVQAQGSSHLAPAQILWRIDAASGCSDLNLSDPKPAGVTANQTGSWSEAATPDRLIGGTKSQTQTDDPLQIIGQLGNSPCKANTTQNKTLTLDSKLPTDSQSQLCDEFQDVHTKIAIGSSGVQNCTNGSTTSQNQSVNQSQWQISNTCTDGTCTKKGVTVAAATISPNPVEGKSFSGPVGTFTDLNAANAPSDTATIDWGDGSASPADGNAVTVSGCSNGTCTVSGTHKYAEEGVYTTKVTVTDAGDATTDAQPGSATVDDAALTLTGTTVATASTNVPESVVASFTDADPAGTATDYTGTINWGPNEGSSPADGKPVNIVSNGSGGFNVTGQHNFQPGGSWPKSITVTVKDAGPTYSVTSTIALPACASTGCFTIGNNVDMTKTVEFWGSDWCKQNNLSTGACSNSAYKGFENTTTAPTAGGWWGTNGGNSPPPPATIPTTMSVIVTSAVCPASLINTGACSGSPYHSGLTGNVVKVVVVKVLTYGPDPSQKGTGTVQPT
jgi:hypothetical protein